MSETKCPVCGTELLSGVIELEIREFGKDEKFECPGCGAKLKARMEVEYYVEGDGIFVCSKCGCNDFTDPLELEAHEIFGIDSGSCKPKTSANIDKSTEESS